MAEEARPPQIATDWTSLGGAPQGGAAVASWGTFESEIFAVLQDGQIWNRYWDGKAWHQWESLGGTFVGTPAASARGPDRIDVLGIGSDGVVRQRWWDGTQWVPWREVAGTPQGAVTVSCSWIGEELRAFVTGADGAIWYGVLR